MAKVATPAAARKKLTTARAKLAAAQEVVRVAQLLVSECEREVEAADAALAAREEAKTRAKAAEVQEKADREAEKARAKAEQAAVKARAKSDQVAAKARAKTEKNGELVRTHAQAALALYEEALDPSFSFEKLDTLVQSFTKALNKDQLVEIAHQMNIPGSFKSKKDAINQIRGKIAFRRNTLERVDVSSASKPLTAGPIGK